jgi:hypothetical protein
MRGGAVPALRGLPSKLNPVHQTAVHLHIGHEHQRVGLRLKQQQGNIGMAGPRS